MAAKSRLPSISSTAFDCPHCGAFTTQYWFRIIADAITGNQKTPNIPSEDFRATVQKSKLPEENKTTLIEWIDKMNSGLVFLKGKEASYYDQVVQNLFLSRCFDCEKFAVWLHDGLIYPTALVGPPANPDLTPEVLGDYEEAARIVNESPRGSAALLRLALQKLCMVLGEKGEKIDKDIESLVKKGLSPMVQQALDAVRVIGNEAVHPGTLDLKDDRDTAMRLFGLVNIIAEQMISNPKHVQELYDKLPETTRKAIERRDGKT